MLIGIPVFYLLTFAGLAEESEVEIGAICAALGIGLWVAAGSDDEKLESALSTAEQIGVLEDAILHSNFFGARALTARALASSLVGSLARREPEDLAIFNKYLHGVVEPRSKEQGGQWPEFLDGGREAIAHLS